MNEIGWILIALFFLITWFWGSGGTKTR